MTLEQLRIFVAVAEREHMTQAAEVLGLNQSTVSAAIAALENHYRVMLFHRVGRRIELTESGRVFLHEANIVLFRMIGAEAALTELGKLKRGTLRLNASQTIGSYWLPPYLVRFRNSFPEIKLDVRIGNTAQALESVMSGAVELGFIEGEIDEPSIRQMPIGSDHLVAIVCAGHPMSRQAQITAQDLRALPWVLRERGSGTRSQFEAQLVRLGLAPGDIQVVLELPSNEAVLTAVETGAGATVISEHVANTALRLDALRQLPIDLGSRPFHAIRHQERYLSKAADAFLNILKIPLQPADPASSFYQMYI